MEECEIIIKYLHRLSARQTEENQLLKSDLKQLLYPSKERHSHQISRFGKFDESVKLPKVAFIDRLPASSGKSSANRDGVILPALKQAMNTNVADRRKRQKAVLKARKRVSFPV